MFANLVNKLKSWPTPAHSEASFFSLGKKDGKFFADPHSLHHLDQFQAHQAAAEELNGALVLMSDVRNAMLPLEGTDLDKNPRENIVAVTDLDVNGRKVDAVLTHHENSSVLDARVSENGKTITLFDVTEPESDRLRVGFGDHFYKVGGKTDNSVVDVERR